MSENIKTYTVGVYLRLSRDDGDKNESDSIVNQRNFIHNYLESYPNINIYDEYVDDGYSGVNFNRPSFQRMMDDIKAGNINCIIVKDLSRFGRNFIEVGKYLDRLFPRIGIRFIAINDHFDSIEEKSQMDSIVVPFKNLINDDYCRDISNKVRSHLATKRKAGEYVGSFAVFGYKKLLNKKNKLFIDDFAANVVQNIFNWKIEGISQVNIAKKLNELGVPSPAQYKQTCGINYKTPLQKKQTMLWSPIAIARILKNEVYTGVLIQGKVTTPNYKIDKRIDVPIQEQVRIENAHEAIISKETFDIANKLLLEDTRTAPSKNKVYLFAGLLKCADCQQNMNRKIVPSGDKKYVYYVCSTNKNGDGCTSHLISEQKLMETILICLQHHISEILEIESTLKYISSLPLQKGEIKMNNEQLKLKEEEIEKFEKRKLSLYENYADGIIDKEEYIRLKERFSAKIKEAQNSIITLKRQIDDLMCNTTNHDWINQFKEHQNISELSRKLVVTLISKILVYDSEHVKIIFKYEDEYFKAVNFIKQTNETILQQKEAI